MYYHSKYVYHRLSIADQYYRVSQTPVMLKNLISLILNGFKDLGDYLLKKVKYRMYALKISTFKMLKTR